MNKLTQKQLGLISIAVAELIERLETQGDDYDIKDIEQLKGAHIIIDNAIEAHN